MIYSFEEILEKIPNIIKEKLENLKNLRERPDYHPEESCYEHIKIVYNRLLITEDVDLILSAILHDICKMDYLSINTITGYPTCHGHDKGAYDFIMNNKEVKDFIIHCGGNISNVAEICKHHMRIKLFYEMKKSKQDKLKSLSVYNKLIIFKLADNMLEDFIYIK